MHFFRVAVVFRKERVDSIEGIKEEHEGHQKEWVAKVIDPLIVIDGWHQEAQREATQY